MKHSDEISDRERIERAWQWWSSLGAPATAGTTLGNWDADVYHDAVCFRRRNVEGDDAYLVRGSHVWNFGFDQDSLEDIYQEMVRVERAALEHGSRLMRWSRRFVEH